MPSTRANKLLTTIVYLATNLSNKPVISVIITCFCPGVHVITNQSVRVLVTANVDLLPFLE